MTVLQAADISFGYGAETLFQDITFSLALAERAALVAPNGAGKTTLLRIVAGELAPDTGSVVVRRDARIGFYRQSHELRNQGTIIDALMSGFSEVLSLRADLVEARIQAASGSKIDLDRLAHAEERYHLAQGDALERRVEQIAHSLGFAQDQIDRPVVSLSGGERGRLNLGIVLAQRPEILLLDEPTNHLDLQTIEWLEKHLVDYPGAVLIVSHDRTFLDNVCPRTFELGQRSFRVYPLRYSDYAVAREDDLERERALAERQQALISKTEDFIRKNIAGQKTKQAQSRRKMLEKIDRIDRPEDVFEAAQKVSFRFAPAPRTGDIVLECKEMGASRSDRSLFSNLDLLVRRGTRLAIVGPNGCGKTTLLKILADKAPAEDQGQVRRGTNLCEGYFDQNLGSLDPQKSAVEEIRAIRADMNVDTARTYLARFRFWGDQAFQKVGGMSGGERTRLALAKLLLEPLNLLFLDEPTNHLDIPAAQILEEALQGFDGTTIFVSHDRKFLENVSTQVLAFTDEGIEVYPNGYADYVAHKNRPLLDEFNEDDEVPCSARDSKKPQAIQASTVEKSSGRLSFEANKAIARALQKKQRRLTELEELISSGEAELTSLRNKIKNTPGDDWEKLSKWAQDEQALSKKVDGLVEEWTILGEEVAQDQAAISGDGR